MVSLCIPHEINMTVRCVHVVLMSNVVLTYDCNVILFAFQGVLKGFDQATNIILDESHERVFSTRVRITLCTRLNFFEELFVGIRILILNTV